MKGALVQKGMALGVQGKLQLLCSQLGQQQHLLVMVVPLLVKQLLHQPWLPVPAAFCAAAAAAAGLDSGAA